MDKIAGILTVYAFPEGVQRNNDYSVKVRLQGADEWQELFCHDALIGEWYRDDSKTVEHMSFSYFSSDFVLPVEVLVKKTEGKIDSAKIRPVFYGLWYEIKENEIFFVMKEPHKISVEINNDLYHNLFIFADYLEDIPEPNNNTDLLYFGPGLHHIEQIALKSNQTVYIHGGAIVYGCFTSDHADNITIKGRGILDGSMLSHDVDKRRLKMISTSYGNNIAIEGIIIRDPPSWAVVPKFCNNVKIDNIKQIAYNANSDGIDLCSCTQVTIKNAFLRNHDDNISIKSFGGDNKNIVMKDCVLWSDRAHNMLIGPESDPKQNNIFERICFSNIDVLEHKEYDETYMGVMALMCADNAVFRDIKWENVRIEDISYGKPISIQFVREYASTEGAEIRDICFENIDYWGKTIFKNRIYGFDDTRLVDGVTINNFRINGNLQDGSSTKFQINEFVKNIIWTGFW